MNKLHISKTEALQKLKQYCIYQERCHLEVKEKLYSLGLHRSDVEQIVAQLIEENYLNEERFAIQFAGGKFRMKQWGRVKIRYELKQKQVSEYSIKKALKQISEEDYAETLNKLAEQKLKELESEKNVANKKRRLHAYLLQKGFEGQLITQVLTGRFPVRR